MQGYSVQEVAENEKAAMKKFLTKADSPLSVDTIACADNEFETKQQVVAVLHALISDGVVSHNIEREYYLI